ncbi:MAG TPA: DinB family protein [Candidatus Angelobacter sp.]|nr:DinB family protein [Candidatus Angelobacter sp.]
MDRTEGLIAELTSARTGFFDALDALDPATLERPGIEGEWSARELVAHLGYWAGYVVEVIGAVEDGRVEELYANRPAVDDVNATVAKVARDTNLGTVRKRESASVDALVERLRRMDPSLLDAPLPSGYPVEALVRDDGIDHYRNHAAALRGEGAQA